MEEFIKLYKDVPTLYMQGTIYITNGFSDLSRHRRDPHKFCGVSESIGTPTEILCRAKCLQKKSLRMVKNGWARKSCWLLRSTLKDRKTERHPNLKDMEYGLDEIQQQCFSMATYDQTLRHYNFTVKMKKDSDDDWSLTPYFAQVSEFCGRKIYTCFKLSPHDDGHCFACTNQGVYALKHPILATMYQGGGAFTSCPFTYFSDDSDLE